MKYKNRITDIFALSALAILLTGCFTYFEPDIKSTPVVCINSLLTSGEKIKVEVTRTWRYTEGNPRDNLDISLKDAEVYLYVNDKLEEKLELRYHKDDDIYWHWGSHFNGVDCYYAANYIPSSGDKIRIYAADKKYGEAEAEVTIPYPIEIEEIKTNITKFDSSYNELQNTYSADFDMILSVAFTDPASTINYYSFDMQTEGVIKAMTEDEYYAPNSESIRLTPDYEFEPLFSEHISPLETIITDAYGLYSFFSDRQISGKQYSLVIPTSGRYWCDLKDKTLMDQNLSINIDLSHISTDYYKFMISFWAGTEGISGALGGVGLGDAVFEFSNVSTGAGIVAAQSKSTYRLDVRQLIGKHIENDRVGNQDF